MRAVAQRVISASVEVEGECVGAIGPGLIVYLGAERGDGPADRKMMADKLAGLRVFRGEDGRMSLSVAEVGGALLVVPQFTLFGDVRRGRRPSFEAAAAPEDGRLWVDEVCQRIRDHGLQVETGRFGAMMRVVSDGDGPITILIDSRKRF